LPAFVTFYFASEYVGFVRYSHQGQTLAHSALSPRRRNDGLRARWTPWAGPAAGQRCATPRRGPAAKRQPVYPSIFAWPKVKPVHPEVNGKNPINFSCILWVINFYLEWPLTFTLVFTALIILRIFHNCPSYYSCSLCGFCWHHQTMRTK